MTRIAIFGSRHCRYRINVTSERIPQTCHHIKHIKLLAQVNFEISKPNHFYNVSPTNTLTQLATAIGLVDATFECQNTRTKTYVHKYQDDMLKKKKNIPLMFAYLFVSASECE